MQIKTYFKKAIDSKKKKSIFFKYSQWLDKGPRSNFSCSPAWSEFPSPVQDTDQMFHKSG